MLQPIRLVLRTATEKEWRTDAMELGNRYTMVSIYRFGADCRRYVMTPSTIASA